MKGGEEMENIGKQKRSFVMIILIKLGQSKMLRTNNH